MMGGLTEDSTVQGSLCQTWSVTEIVGFLMQRLNYNTLLIMISICKRQNKYIGTIFITDKYMVKMISYTKIFFGLDGCIV